MNTRQTLSAVFSPVCEIRHIPGTSHAVQKLRTKPILSKVGFTSRLATWYSSHVGNTPRFSSRV